MKIAVLIILSIFLVKPGFAEISRSNLNNLSPAVLTLPECYKMALQNNENIAIKLEIVKEAKAKLMQATGSVLPKVNFNYTYSKQGPSKSGNLPSYAVSSESHQSKFSLTETIFSGLKEYAGFAAADIEKNQRLYEKSDAELNLFNQVCDTYFLAIEQKETLKVLIDIKKIYTELMDVLKKREKIGRSRKSEVINAQASAYLNDANIESVKTLEDNYKRTLGFLIVIDRVNELRDTDENMDVSVEEDFYLSKVLTRPDVMAADSAYRLAKKVVLGAGAGFLPTFTLLGNYYINRTGRYQGPDWDMAFQLDIPILPVLQNLGELNQARYKVREAELNFQLTKRNAKLEIDSAYKDLQGALVRRSAYEKALKESEENYRLQKEDYNLALISNIDLLVAIQSLQTARLSFISIAYETKRLYYHLRVVTGDTL